MSIYIRVELRKKRMLLFDYIRERNCTEYNVKWENIVIGLLWMDAEEGMTFLLLCTNFYYWRKSRKYIFRDR